MSNDYVEFGFGSGDENLSSGKFDRFKAKEGESYRVSFVWWDMVAGKPDLGGDSDDPPKSPRFIRAKRHFLQNVGYFLSKGPEYDRLAGGPPKMQVATVIVIWPTTRKGELDKARFQAGDFDVKPWTFGQEKYEQLKRRHEEFPFGTHDLTIACTDTQFQKMDLSPCRDNLFRKCLENEKLRPFVDAILTKVSAIVGANERGEAVGLLGVIGRDLTLDKIREKLGGAPATTPIGGDMSQVDAILDDLID